MNFFKYILIFILIVSGSINLKFFAQPLGDWTVIGNTFNDAQSCGNVGRTICLNAENNVHMCWNSGNPGAQIKYNHHSPESMITFPGGIFVTFYEMGIQSNLTVNNNGSAVIAFIATIQDINYDAITIQSDTSLTNFNSHLMPTLTGHTLGVPRVAVDSRGWYHILAHTPENLHSHNKALYYNRSEDNCSSWEGWTFADSVRTVCESISVSPSGKVSFTWSRPLNIEFVSPIEMVNNDIYSIESPDGSTPEFQNAINITDFENGLHPKSDSLRVFEDISTLYDESDELHIVYTCAGYIQTGGPAYTTPGSEIYHYSESTGFTYITGELESGPVINENRRYYDRPSLGYNQGTDEIFCIWDQYSDPADTSSEGYRNGDIWGAFSSDDGADWSLPINLTDTPSPGALPGNCLSEERPCLAEGINDTLHLIYLMDLAPGLNYGNYTFPVLYHQISVEEFKAQSSVESREEGFIAERINIEAAYPNPFNSSAKLRFNIDQSENISIKIFDLRGREIVVLAEEYFQPGEYEITWSPANLTSGIYFTRFESEGITEIQKIVLLK